MEKIDRPRRKLPSVAVSSVTVPSVSSTNEAGRSSRLNEPHDSEARTPSMELSPFVTLCHGVAKIIFAGD
jgi:hypothetical protein